MMRKRGRRDDWNGAQRGSAVPASPLFNLDELHEQRILSWSPEPEELFEDARSRRAVHERVVISPDEVEVVVGQSEEGKTQEGKSGEVEGATAVVIEEAREASLAFFGGEA